MAREFEIRTVHPPWDRAHDHFSETEARLNLATAARVNLYALPGPLAFGPALSATLMFLSALRGTWSGRLRVSASLLEAPDFQRRPVAEMLGIAVTMEIAKRYGWDGQGPQSVDSLRQYWGSDKKRPDLLFTRHGSDLQFVGEAKGRIIDPTAFPQSAPQHNERKWLRKLETWYATFGLQYFLSVAHGSVTGVRAHVFDPGEPRLVYPPAALSAAIASREDALSRTAPLDGVEVQDGRVLRGTWRSVPSDQTTDEVESEVFLGVIDGPPLSEPFELETATELVSSSGRLLVVLRRGGGQLAASLGPSDAASSHPVLAGRFQISRGGRTIAWGRNSSSGFEVAAGSFSRQPRGSLRSSDRSLRRQLLSQGVLTRLEIPTNEPDPPAVVVFQEPYEFRSAAQAARIILGTSASSREWE